MVSSLYLQGSPFWVQHYFKSLHLSSHPLRSSDNSLITVQPDNILHCIAMACILDIRPYANTDTLLTCGQPTWRSRLLCLSDLAFSLHFSYLILVSFSNFYQILFHLLQTTNKSTTGVMSHGTQWKEILNNDSLLEIVFCKMAAVIIFCIMLLCY